MLADITVGDVLELMDREAEYFACPARDHKVFYRMLRELGIFGDEAPERLRAFRTAGQLTPDELVDRYQLQCRPVRDLLVDYLRERQPAMDYTSLKMLAYYLAQAVLGRPRGAPSRHRQPAPARRGRRGVEAAAADQAPDHHRAGRGEDRRHRRADRLPPVPDPGPGLLPGPVPVGDRGPRPVGAVGRALPGRAGRDQPAQIRAPPQGPHGRADPGTAAGPAGAGPHRRRAAQERRRAPGGRPPGPARRGIHRRGPDADPARSPKAARQDLGRRPGQPASAATSASKTTTRSGPGPPSRSSGSRAAGSRNCWRSATTA